MATPRRKIATMAPPTIEPEPTLSIPANLVALFWIPFTLVRLWEKSPNLALAAIPFLGLPIVCLRLLYRQGPSNIKHVETLIWIYFGTVIIGFRLVALLRAVLSMGLIGLIFGPQADDFVVEVQRIDLADLSGVELQRRAELVSSWEFFAFYSVFSFVFVGLLEEGYKYLVIKLAKRYGSVKFDTDYVNCALAAQMGLSIFANSSSALVDAHPHESVLSLVGLLAVHLIRELPAYMSGALMAQNMVGRDLWKKKVGWINILGFPTLYHGAFDFAVWGINAWTGSISWSTPGDFIHGLAVVQTALMIAVGVVVHATVRAAQLFDEP